MATGGDGIRRRKKEEEEAVRKKAEFKKGNKIELSTKDS
jgi:hypothetical protein